MGAILTQNTAWTNVEKAIINLKQGNCLTPQAILDCPQQQLATWLIPSGYFNVKAARLKRYCDWYITEGEYPGLEQMETPLLRKKLLAVSGIGPETADDILLYAFHRPVFVIDAYTRRLLQRLRLIKGNESYEILQELMESHLPRDAALFNEYHALVVVHAKQQCRKRKPSCIDCCLIKVCRYPDQILSQS